MWKLSVLKTNRPSKSTFSAIFFAACLALSVSFFVEFFLEKRPCFLCTIQRALYLSLLVSTLIGIVSSFTAMAKMLCQISLICIFAVAGYHSLIQFEVIKDTCKTESKIGDIESYKKLLLKTENSAPSCSDNSWSIGGIPLSIINGLMALGLFCFLNRYKLRNHSTSHLHG
jgi:disulfide bond formation protein DsbB